PNQGNSDSCAGWRAPSCWFCAGGVRVRRFAEFKRGRIVLFRKSNAFAGLFLSVCLAAPGSLFGANHREAPITALDHKADITDVFAFRSYDPADTTPHVTLILCVDPLLEPG